MTSYIPQSISYWVPDCAYICTEANSMLGTLFMELLPSSNTYSYSGSIWVAQSISYLVPQCPSIAKSTHCGYTSLDLYYIMAGFIYISTYLYIMNTICPRKVGYTWTVQFSHQTCIVSLQCMAVVAKDLKFCILYICQVFLPTFAIAII